MQLQAFDCFQAYQNLLNVLALPFSPLASEGLQQKQVAEIATRMHRYKDLCFSICIAGGNDGLRLNMSLAQVLLKVLRLR